jgi:hypothetical protein
MNEQRAVIQQMVDALDHADELLGGNDTLVMNGAAAGRWLLEQPAPVQELWVGLSEDEINKLRHLVDWTAEWSYGRFAYELERLLREKNT